ncbi:hypothetical protein JX266_010749 [Neoarthrinium moseri]|nr:hypothetical protein JX266_010749 [Neoarthrinium moseri]
MYLPNMLLTLLLQASSLTLTLASPVLSPRASGPACTYLDSIATAPSCPGGCCGWKLTPTSSPFCEASAGTSTVALAGSSATAGWLDACAALRRSVSDGRANYILTTFQQGMFHAVADGGGCRFEVSVNQPEDGNDPFRIASSDVAAFLDAGLAVVAGAGQRGATGSTSCYGYDSTWRMVPPGN